MYIFKLPLYQVIHKRYGLDATAVGDEGGFAPNILDNNEGLELLLEAFKSSGHADKVNANSKYYLSKFSN